MASRHARRAPFDANRHRRSRRVAHVYSGRLAPWAMRGASGVRAKYDERGPRLLFPRRAAAGAADGLHGGDVVASRRRCARHMYRDATQHTMTTRVGLGDSLPAPSRYPIDPDRLVRGKASSHEVYARASDRMGWREAKRWPHRGSDRTWRRPPLPQGREGAVADDARGDQRKGDQGDGARRHCDCRSPPSSGRARAGHRGADRSGYRHRGSRHRDMLLD